MNIVTTTRTLLTIVIIFIASLLAYNLWQRYMYSPWTRDGRVHVQVVEVASDVSGRVVSMAVRDNEFVHKGAILFKIDPERYIIASEHAKANLAAARASLQAAVAAVQESSAAIEQAKADYDMRRSEAERRLRIGSAVSREARGNAEAAALAAKAALDAQHARWAQANAMRTQAQAGILEANAALKLAELNLARTDVRAPVGGYVTHLRTYSGEYAHAGEARISIVNSHDFWISGYFEETKLPHIHIGDHAEIELIDGIHLQGTVESIARGISDTGGSTGSDGLAQTAPTLSWVRLAQRIPVRIRIDMHTLPKGMVLAAGMTATIVLKHS